MCGNGCAECPNRVECGLCPEFRDRDEDFERYADDDFRRGDDLDDYEEIDENGVSYDSPGYAD